MTAHISRQIAEHVTSVRYEDIGEAALFAARRATLDTIGAIIAGSAAPLAAPCLRLARQWGGTPEATVLAGGFKVPAPWAAWCNGTMARALEINDCTDFLPLHPSASTVPTLLALAEATRGLSGRDFLTALAIGQDIKVRMGLATKANAMMTGRYNVFKVFGPTAAAAHALGLDADACQNALGIAYGHACGEGQSALDGAMSLPLQQGNVAKAGIMAALLAQQGVTGPRDFLFGRMGFFHAFEPDHDPAPLVHELGRYFWGEQVSIKPYSACRCCHTPIAMVLGSEAYAAHDLDAIQRITVTVPPSVQGLVGRQLDECANPTSAAAAQFSLPYALAATFKHGDFFLRQLELDAITDPQVAALAHRIKVVADPALATPDFVLGRTHIDIDTASGREHLEGFKPPGNPAHPLDFDAVADKVRKCAQAALPPPSAASLERMIALVADLDRLPDVRAVVAALEW